MWNNMITRILPACPVDSMPNEDATEEGRTAEPVLTVTVGGMTLPFLVDTGATYSISSDHPFPTSDNDVAVQGIAGQLLHLKKTVPLETQAGNQKLLHYFLLSPQCPVNLLGRDILVPLQAEKLFHQWEPW